MITTTERTVTAMRKDQDGNEVDVVMGLSELLELAKDSFAYIGYRTVDAGTDPLRHSREWNDGRPTEEYEDGVGCTNANVHIEQHCRWYQCNGTTTHIIAGNHASYHLYEADSIIIEDAILIGTIND